MANVKKDIENSFLRQDKNDFIFKIGNRFCAFSGHFPNQPLLPGIVQMEIAAFCARKLLNNENAKLARADKVKFVKPVLPESEIICRIEPLSLNEPAAVFKAIIKDDKEIYSQMNIAIQNA
jgi:3-hydroxymyristoyl/3-hydroxydecanoyl-(acyl carrier protein) dehydratase